MNLNTIVALCADTTFQGQIHAAMLSQAHTVLNETAGTHATLQNKRWSLASSVLADGGTSMLNRFVWGIATTPGFSAVVNDTTDTNDAAIASAMVSQWSTLALASYQDQNN